MTIATRRGVALGVVLWATVLTVGVQAQTVETNAVAGCEKDINAQMEDLGGKYSSDLDMLRVKFQSQGDLNNTLVVKSEADRFAATRRLSKQETVKEPVALRELQEKYVGLQAQVAQQISRRWVENLEQSKRELTIVGKLDEAQQTQGQIDALRKAHGGATVSEPPTTSPAMTMTALETCDKDVVARRKDLLLKYRIELTALKTAAQQEGDLDGLLATDKEYKRVLVLDTLNEQDLVTKSVALRELQRKYIGQIAIVGRATAAVHIDRLKETKRQLTVTGKIAEAVATQKDIEKLETKYLGGGGTSGAGDTGGSTDDVVEQCERAIQERTAKMHAEYEQQLAQLAVNYQKRGELEKLLVVKSEQERFGRVKQIAERDLLEAPDELAQLQAKYQQGPEVVKLAVATEWLTKLQEQKKRLTMENKLDKALEVQKQMDTIIRKYDITAEKLTRMQAALGASRISTEPSRTPPNYVEFGKTSCAILKTPRDLLNKTDITYEAWIFPDNEIQEGLIMFDGNEVAGHDNWLSYKAGKIVAVNNFDPKVQLESKGRVPAKRWSHVALVLEQKRMAIFINGSLDSEIRTAIGQHENTSAVFLGRNIYFGKVVGEQFLGRVAYFRIWERALTGQEIALTFTGRQSSNSGLIAEWGFADGSFASTKGKQFNSTSVGDVRIVNLEKAGAAAGQGPATPAPSAQPQSDPPPCPMCKGTGRVQQLSKTILCPYPGCTSKTQSEPIGGMGGDFRGMGGR